MESCLPHYEMKYILGVRVTAFRQQAFLPSFCLLVMRYCAPMTGSAGFIHSRPSPGPTPPAGAAFGTAPERCIHLCIRAPKSLHLLLQRQ